DELLESSRRQDHAAPAPIYYQLMPGNLCNLKCRMCVPMYSSQIERDPVHRQWAPLFLEHLGRPPLDWTTGGVAVAPHPVRDVRLDGFHDLEDHEAVPFRWTKGRAAAVVTLPRGRRAESVRVRLRKGRRGQRLRLLVNGVTVYDRAGLWKGLDLTFPV